MIGYAIIAAVIVFGGILALLGDRVGMKVGKKKLSLFGMRPKYTSMVITVLTGFFIAGLTLIVLSLVSDYVHTAIFRLKAIQTELAVTTKEYSTLTEEYGKLLKDLETVVAERQKREEQLAQIQDQYDLTRKKLSNATEELALAQKRSQNLAQINENLQKQIANLNLQETRLNQQIQNLESLLKSLEDRHQTIVGRPIIFYVGEILVAEVINPNRPSANIFEDIIAPLLNEANQIALKRGARIPGKTDYALRISPYRISEVNRQISELKEKAVLRVTVEKNSVAGEPLTATLELFPNERIFSRGETIVATKLLSVVSESDLRDQILSLLILAINKAIQKGIITDGQNLRNIISISEIAKVINEIKGSGGELFQVSVVAEDNIYRVDPFQVKLTVQDLRESDL